MIDQRAVLRIGEVSRRTGVAVPTLRAWERRYGVLDPARTDGGHRLYSDRDVARVGAMQRLLEGGWSASAAAREVLRDPPTRAPAPSDEASSDGAAGQLIRQLMAGIDRFSATDTDAIVDDTFARYEVPRALDAVLLPVLRDIGEGWEEDARAIAREHFATNVVRPRLQRLLRRPVPAAAPSCVAAAPEHEEHDLGLLAAAAVAVDAGWRVHYLGARTPTAAMERAVTELAPAVVLVGAIFREQAEAFLGDRPVFPRTGVVLGGAGFIASDESRLPGALVHHGPMRALPATLERATIARPAR